MVGAMGVGSRFRQSLSSSKIEASNRSKNFAENIVFPEVEKVLLKEEQWALDDWNCIKKQLSGSEVSFLDCDIIVRTLRSNRYIPQPERRISKTLKFWRDLAKWNVKYGVWRIRPDFVVENVRALQKKKGVVESFDTDALQDFVTFVSPIKCYGSIANNNPLFKISLQECRWHDAQELFNSKHDVAQFCIIVMERLLQISRSSGNQGKSADISIFITGKLSIIFDLEGLSLKMLKDALKLGLPRALRMVTKYYPETVQNIYLIHSRAATVLLHVVSPLLSKGLLEQVRIFKDDQNLFNHLTQNEKINPSELPVEIGGRFEGNYVISCCD